MLFDTQATNAAEASLDALWKRTQVISNNLANVDTPGFKAQDVSFGEVLNKKVKASQTNNPSNPQNPSNVRTAGTKLSAVNDNRGIEATYRTTITQNNDTSVRVDGNNVSLEAEQTKLWKTYAQYSYLLDKINGHYSNINNAISNVRSL